MNEVAAAVVKTIEQKRLATRMERERKEWEARETKLKQRADELRHQLSDAKHNAAIAALHNARIQE